MSPAEKVKKIETVRPTKPAVEVKYVKKPVERPAPPERVQRAAAQQIAEQERTTREVLQEVVSQKKVEVTKPRKTTDETIRKVSDAKPEIKSIIRSTKTVKTTHSQVLPDSILRVDPPVIEIPTFRVEPTELQEINLDFDEPLETPVINLDTDALEIQDQSLRSSALVDIDFPFEDLIIIDEESPEPAEPTFDELVAEFLNYPDPIDVSENIDEHEEEIAEVFEQVTERLAQMEPEVVEEISAPVIEALQVVQEVQADPETPFEVIEQAEVVLVDAIQEFIEEIGLELSEEEVQEFAQIFIQKEVLEAILSMEPQSLLEIFGKKGTFEGLRYVSRIINKTTKPIHIILGKIVLMPELAAA